MDDVLAEPDDDSLVFEEELEDESSVESEVVEELLEEFADELGSELVESVDESDVKLPDEPLLKISSASNPYEVSESPCTVEFIDEELSDPLSDDLLGIMACNNDCQNELPLPEELFVESPEDLSLVSEVLADVSPDVLTDALFSVLPLDVPNVSLSLVLQHDNKTISISDKKKMPANLKNKRILLLH